jgi:hypothetical protein
LKTRLGLSDGVEVVGFEEARQNVDDQEAGLHAVEGRDDVHEPTLCRDRPSAKATNPTGLP